MTDSFLQEKFDNRRFFLLNLNKIWQIAVGAAVGACLFAFLYYLKTDLLQGEPIYRARTLYEITFDREQEGNIHDYYNDYTWNDILDSDRIAGSAAAKLGDISKEEIAAATTIPTMSDIRFIWVYVDMESREQADRVMAAISESLKEFALTTDGFSKITVWDEKETAEVREDSLIGRMTVAGAVIGALAACFVIVLTNAMDDSVYTRRDAEEKFGVIPAGVIMKSERKQPEFFEKELADNLQKLLGEKFDIDDINKTRKIGLLWADPVCGISAGREQEYLKEVLSGYFPKADIVDFSAGFAGQPEKPDGDLSDKKKEENVPGRYQALRETDAYILLVPYGGKNGAALELMWKDLTLQECLPDAVVIVGADDRFYRHYYRK